MRPLGALLIVVGLALLAASRLVTAATLDVVLVVVGVVVLLAGLGLLVFGRSNRDRRDERRADDGAADRGVAGRASAGEARITGGQERDLSSPVPLGPSSEAGASPGTGTSAPGPVVRTTELPAPSTASANLAPPMPTAPALDDGSAVDADRLAQDRRAASGAQPPTLDDGEAQPR